MDNWDIRSAIGALKYRRLRRVLNIIVVDATQAYNDNLLCSLACYVGATAEYESHRQIALGAEPSAELFKETYLETCAKIFPVSVLSPLENKALSMRIADKKSFAEDSSRTRRYLHGGYLSSAVRKLDEHTRVMDAWIDLIKLR